MSLLLLKILLSGIVWTEPRNNNNKINDWHRPNHRIDSPT
jgi:hypothetical protein